MIEMRGGVSGWLRVLVVVLVLSFSTLSSGSSEDEGLLKKATQIFGPYPG